MPAKSVVSVARHHEGIARGVLHACVCREGVTGWVDVVCVCVCVLHHASSVDVPAPLSSSSLYGPLLDGALRAEGATFSHREAAVGCHLSWLGAHPVAGSGPEAAHD